VNALRRNVGWPLAAAPISECRGSFRRQSRRRQL
jgi:hypothetical protein